MKTFSIVTFITILLLPIHIFSQIDNNYSLNLQRLLIKRINPFTTPDEIIKQRLKKEYFNDLESRTIINREILDNGFLLFEEVNQDWDGLSWVNDWKYTYT